MRSTPLRTTGGQPATAWAKGTGWGKPLAEATFGESVSDIWAPLSNVTQSHWSTDDTNIDFVDHVLVPYIDNVIRDNNLPSEQKATLVVDCHWAWLSAKFRDHLKEKYPAADGGSRIILLFVPACCTHLYQTIDTGACALVKAVARRLFQGWILQQVLAGPAEHGDPNMVCTPMSFFVP